MSGSSRSRRAIRLPNDEPETWEPTMPEDYTPENPNRPPLAYPILRDLAPIEERGAAPLIKTVLRGEDLQHALERQQRYVETDRG